MNKKHIKEEGLRDWFGKSKSKGGKKGWVNVVTGDSCASDKPGEGIPKCVSSSKRASMSKKERVSAQAAKRREDPGQQKKSGASAPTNVKTDRKVRKEAMEVNGALDENVSSGKSRLAKMGRVPGKPTGAITNTEKSAELKKQKDVEKSKDKAVADKVNVSGLSPADALTKKRRAEFKAEKERLRAQKKMRREETEVLDEAKDKKTKGSGTKDACYTKVKSRYSVWPSAYASGALVKCRKVGAANWGNKSEETEFDSISFQQFQEKCWKGYEKKGMKKMFGKKYPNCVKAEGYGPGDVDQKVGAVTAIPKSEQDAARARLLAKTKAKMKKEEVEIAEAPKYDKQGLDKFDRSKRMIRHKQNKYGVSTLKQSIMTGADHNIDNEKKAKMKKEEIEIEEKAKDCWDTYKKVGMKMKGGKLVNDCRPKNEETEVSEGWKSALAGAGVAAALMSQGGQKAPDKKTTSSSSTSNTERVSTTSQSKKLSPMDKWKKNHPELAKKSDNPQKFNRKKLSPVNKDWAKANPKLAEKEKDNRSKLGESAAWTKKSGKNKSGGLNEKGRKSYEAENPGSDLKAPSKKKGNKRRASFCARMKGMKKKLTSAKTARDPDSRINKSLRAWNC